MMAPNGSKAVTLRPAASTHSGHRPNALESVPASSRQAGSHRDITSLRACAVPVGAGLPGDGPRSGPGLRMAALGRNRSVVTGCVRPKDALRKIRGAFTHPLGRCPPQRSKSIRSVRRSPPRAPASRAPVQDVAVQGAGDPLICPS